MKNSQEHMKIIKAFEDEYNRDIKGSEYDAPLWHTYLDGVNPLSTIEKWDVETREIAIKRWSKSISDDPNDLVPLLLRAGCYQVQQDYTSSLEDLRQVYRLLPMYEMPGLHIVGTIIHLLIETDNLIEAAIFFKEDEKREDRFPAYDLYRMDFLALGEYWESIGDLESAIACYEEYNDIVHQWDDEYYDPLVVYDDKIDIEAKKHVEETQLRLTQQRGVKISKNREFADSISNDSMALERYFWTLIDIGSNDIIPDRNFETWTIALIFYKWVCDQQMDVEAENLFGDLDIPPVYNWYALTSSRTPQWDEDRIQKTYGLGLLQEAFISLHKHHAFKHLDISMIKMGYPDYEIMSSGSIFKVLQALDNVDFSSKYIKKDAFGSAFSALLSHLSSHNRKAFSEHSSSDKITEVVSSLLKAKGVNKVYDPAIGMGNLCLSIVKANRQQINEKHIIVGNEIDQRSAFFGQMNLIVNGFLDSQVSVTNSLFSSTDDDKMYDVAVCHPPFGQRVGNQDYSKTAKGLPTTEFRFLDKMLSAIKTGGKYAIIVPEYLLMQTGKTQTYRKWLVEKDYIDMIFGLPEGAHLNTTSKTAIIFGTKRLKQRKTRKIHFYNADDLLKLNGLQIGNNGLLNLHQLKSQAIIESTFLEQLEYRLAPSAYCQSDIHETIQNYLGKNTDLVSLQDISDKIQRGRKFSSIASWIGGQYPVVTIKELKRGSDDPNLQVENLKRGKRYSVINATRESIKKRLSNFSEQELVRQDCVLIQSTGSNLNPTIFRYDSDPIAPNEGLIVLLLSEKTILPEFLIGYLKDLSFLKQLQLIRGTYSGAVVSIKAFREIKVDQPPSIEEQKIRTSKDISLLSNIKRRHQQEIETLKSENSDLSAYIRFVRHELSQSIDASARNQDIIYDYLLEFHPDVLLESIISETEPSENNGTKVQWFINQVKGSLGLMDDEMKMIEIVSNGLAQKDLPKKLFPIKRILAELKQRHETSNIKIIVDNSNNSIFADPRTLQIALNQIVLNAIRHGKRDNRDLIIKFETFRRHHLRGKVYTQIICRNNGIPLPAGCSVQSFSTIEKTFGRTGNTGIGGWVVSMLVELHGGIIERFENLKSGIVEIELLIPEIEDSDE